MRIAGLLLLVALMPLAACSYTTWLTGADENGGTVNGVNQLSTDSAVEKANAHCAQYHKTARVIRTDQASSTLTFSCQAAD